ncbi:MAG: hypothetical protein QOK29_2187 [Rhodospirillaceae bacterium]|jgi:phenylpropionate dioxygenase-like ring-hydroxylating dioxygenase large terminal subunit|nr:hypothetical protein [Rhodospirillaceae bacterium]
MNHLGASIFDPQNYTKVMLPPMQAESLPGWCYTSEAFHRREIERIFSRSWICVGREDNLPRSGDYRTVNLCGTRLVVLRDNEGKIRVLDNVCRHRGTLLLEGNGNVPAIRCPFHNWSYGLDGSLRGAPDMDQTAGFDRKDYGLPAYEATHWNGFIFTRLQKGGPSLEEQLGDMDRLVAPYDLSEMRCAKQKTFTVKCNWKLFLEVFMEDYHLKAVHKSSIAGTYTAPEVQERVNGDFATIFDPHKGTSALLTGEQQLALPPIESPTGTLPAGTRYMLFYPSFAFACTVDCMWFFEIHPDGPLRTQVTMSMCFPQTTLALDDFASKFSAYENRWAISMDEDIVVLEKQQQGMESGRFVPGRFSHLEPVVSMFANWTVRRIMDA